MQIPGSSGTSNPSKIQFPKVHQKITRGGFQGGCGHQVCAYSSTQNFQKIVNYFNVIIDTNVIVSAILSKEKESATVQILELLFDNKINIFYSKEVLDEYIDVLNREKFHFDKELINSILNAIVDNGNNIDPKKIEMDLIDNKDKPFYELVMDEQIDSGKLITGNIKHFPIKTNIITPRQFIEMYEKANN